MYDNLIVGFSTSYTIGCWYHGGMNILGSGPLSGSWSNDSPPPNNPPLGKPPNYGCELTLLTIEIKHHYHGHVVH